MCQHTHTQTHTDRPGSAVGFVLLVFHLPSPFNAAVFVYTIFARSKQLQSIRRGTQSPLNKSLKGDVSHEAHHSEQVCVCGCVYVRVFERACACAQANVSSPGPVLKGSLFLTLGAGRGSRLFQKNKQPSSLRRVGGWALECATPALLSRKTGPSETEPPTACLGMS